MRAPRGGGEDPIADSGRSSTRRATLSDGCERTVDVGAPDVYALASFPHPNAVISGAAGLARGLRGHLNAPATRPGGNAFGSGDRYNGSSSSVAPSVQCRSTGTRCSSTR